MRFTKRFKVSLINDNSLVAIHKGKRHIASATLYGKVFEKSYKKPLPKYVVEDIKAIGIPILRERSLRKKSRKEVLTWFPHLFFKYNYEARYKGYDFHIEYIERNMGYGGKWSHAHYKLYVMFNGKKDHITGGQNYRQALMEAAENYLVKHKIQ